MLWWVRNQKQYKAGMRLKDKLGLRFLVRALLGADRVRLAVDLLDALGSREACGFTPLAQ